MWCMKLANLQDPGECIIVTSVLDKILDCGRGGRESEGDNVGV